MTSAIRTKKDVLAALHERRERLRELGVRRLGLFGSFLRGEQKPASDIDLLVEFEAGKKTFDAFIELAFYLEDILQHKVELVTTDSLSPYLAPHILKEVEYAAVAG